MLISAYITEMPLTFIQARGLIESFELPWLTHIWRRSISYLLVFLHQIVILFLAMAILGAPPRWEMLYAAPALVIVLIAGSGLGMVLGVFGARYRDLQPAMVVVSGFLFFFSPVMWRAEQLRVNEWAVHYNPLYYMITLARDPLLGRVPSADIWIGASLAAVALVGAGFLCFLLSRRRLYHWM
jgi:lipopolysaccharide transport system permease protein